MLGEESAGVALGKRGDTGEEWCREVLGKSGVEKCCRKSGVDQPWGRVV